MNEILKRLYNQHASALLLYARVWCHAPEDALQEAMIELARQTEMPPDPVAWLYQAVRYRAINLHRSEKRRSQREHATAWRREPWFVDTQDQAIDVAAVQDALNSLSELEREIVVAKLWGGLTFEQIGELTRQSSSTVHRHYHTALELLKKKLSGIARAGVRHE